MFCMFFLVVLMSLFCYFWFFFGGNSYMIRLDFLSLNGGSWLSSLVLDGNTCGIILMLLICFYYVLSYTVHYFGNRLARVELNSIICLFVAVMLSLVCTGDFLSTLIFWEYLGVVRFFLILFYGNYLSLRSSIITLVSSRFGDVCLFLVVGLNCYDFSIVNVLLFYFIIFTKSARFPFIRWLLEAMRAPTPVSSLVHSSTLVAAGVWFIMRYDFLILKKNLFYYSIFLLLTVFVTGVRCFYYIDLKKIVALSTCKNIAWCVIYLIFGDTLLSLFQLIRHGVSKCMLFMLVGDVMRGSGGSQGSNCVYSPVFYGKWGIFSMISVILGLSGAPFIGVFYTKHFLLTKFMSISKVLLFTILLIGVFLSYFYSFRLCACLLNIKSSMSFGVLYFFNSGIIVYFWLFINFFISYMLDEVKVLLPELTILLLVFQLVSCIIAYYLYDSKIFSNWSSSLFGCDNIVEACYAFYAVILSFTNLFFYRWDNYVVNIFNRIGIFSIRVYYSKMLNFIIFAVLLMLMWFVIV